MALEQQPSTAFRQINGGYGVESGLSAFAKTCQKPDINVEVVMSNVWQICPAANKYLCVQQMDLQFFNGRFEGVSMADGWSTPPFATLNKSKKVADFTSWQIGRTFLVSTRARDAMLDLCGDDVEFLPFATIKRTALFAANVLRQFAVIDWPACSEDAKIHGGPYRLKEDLDPLPAVFKDPHSSSQTFASNELGSVAVDRGLTGLQLANPRKNLSRMIVHGYPINEFPGL